MYSLSFKYSGNSSYLTSRGGLCLIFVFIVSVSCGWSARSSRCSFRRRRWSLLLLLLLIRHVAVRFDGELVYLLRRTVRRRRTANLDDLDRPLPTCMCTYVRLLSSSLPFLSISRSSWRYRLYTRLLQSCGRVQRSWSSMQRVDVWLVLKNQMSKKRILEVNGGLLVILKLCGEVERR